MKLLRVFTGLLPVTRAVMAGSSANYTLAPGTVDSGGLRGTSANYTVNGSLIAGGAGNSAGYTARTGFAGQLEEPVTGVAVPTAIRITALPAALDEADTRQLAAFLLSSDGRLTPLALDSVSWSVQSGPLTGISAGGLATGVFAGPAGGRAGGGWRGGGRGRRRPGRVRLLGHRRCRPAGWA